MPSLRKRQTAPAAAASKSLQALDRHGIGEIGDGIEALDREPANSGSTTTRSVVAARAREIRARPREKARQDSGEKGYSGAATISFLPLCRHSWYR